MNDTLLSDSLNERQALTEAGDADPVLTDRDARNLAEFVHCMEDLSAVLDEETAALSACDLDVNAAIFARKTQAVQRLERVVPTLEPFLSAALEAKPDLRDRVDALAAKVRENETVLARMAEAAQTIATEHARILDRHSLNGLYAKSGRKLGTSAAKTARIDEHH